MRKFQNGSRHALEVGGRHLDLCRFCSGGGVFDFHRDPALGWNDRLGTKKGLGTNDRWRDE